MRNFLFACVVGLLFCGAAYAQYPQLTHEQTTPPGSVVAGSVYLSMTHAGDGVDVGIGDVGNLHPQTTHLTAQQWKQFRVLYHDLQRKAHGYSTIYVIDSVGTVGGVTLEVEMVPRNDGTAFTDPFVVVKVNDRMFRLNAIYLEDLNSLVSSMVRH